MTTTVLTSEQELVARTLTGDQNAFSLLVELYQQPVFHLCLRMLGNAGDAEDAAQESFLRAFLQLDTFDPARPFKSWLMAIASHYCIDRLRRRRTRWLSLDDEPLVQVLGLHDLAPQPEEMAVQSDQAQWLQHAIAQLPAETRSVLTLRYWGELSCEEIAATTGATVNAVKSRLHRGRAALAELMAREERCEAVRFVFGARSSLGKSGLAAAA